MFSSVKSQSRYKRSAYVSLSSSFLRARFDPLQFSISLQGRYHTLASSPLLPFSFHVTPLRMGLDKCYTPHVQFQSATCKRKTSLRLTETELISFDSVMPAVLELKGKLHFSQPSVHFPCSKSQLPQITTRIERKLRETLQHSATSDYDVLA